MRDIERARKVLEEWRRTTRSRAPLDDRLAGTIADLVAREREACARVADVLKQPSIADAIRARAAGGGPRRTESGAERLVRTFFRLHPNAYYCAQCLAGELKATLRETQNATDTLTRSPDFEYVHFWCSGCARSQAVIRWIKAEAASTASREPAAGARARDPRRDGFLL